jgi:hypothetical protein
MGQRFVHNLRWLYTVNSSAAVVIYKTTLARDSEKAISNVTINYIRAGHEANKNY